MSEESDDYVLYSLNLILDSLTLVEARFSTVKHPDDFVLNDAGIVLLDSIAMRLQVQCRKLKAFSDQLLAFSWMNRYAQSLKMIECLWLTATG